MEFAIGVHNAPALARLLHGGIIADAGHFSLGAFIHV
jgi:hypothetical protein